MNVGGPAVLLKELIDNLPESEFEHILITGRCLSNEIDYLEEHPIESRVIYIDSLKRSIFPTRDFLSFVKMIILLRKLRPNIVHTHTSKAGILGRIATKIASPQTKIVHTFHGHLLYGYFSKNQVKLLIFLERWLAHLTDCLVAVSDKIKFDLLQNRIGISSPWKTIHPAIEFDTSPLSYINRSNFNLNESDFVLLWVGRFTDIKNPMLAAEALRSLYKSGSTSVKMIMVGDGELWESVSKFSQENDLGILFTGWVPDVKKYISVANALLMTSKNEGMPVVILEAAAYSVPSIATNVGGISDFIDDGNNGFLVAQNPESIAISVQTVISMPNLDEVSARAKEVLLTNFNLKRFVQNHTNLYTELNK